VKVEARHLSKWYGQVIGVNDLDFEIGPGVTGFLGPNGAGKSTLLKLMTGQLKPSKGEVLVGGERVWNNEKLNRNIGYCPEQDAFWKFLTGREFVRSLTAMHGFSREESEKRTAHALETAGMTEHADKKIGGYSKGMRQRIKLAQAFAHDPMVLFLDEPLNGMDPVGRRDTIEFIRKAGRDDRTVIVSSHILHEVEEMTDTILLINHGRQLAHGNIFEIRELIDAHPLQVTIRCDQVNVLTAKLLEFDDVLSIQFDRGKGQLTVETKKPRDFHARLPDLVLKHGINIHSLWSPDENLEAVFEYLVR
jgi:ABC-2 type transport system ATP-binding protein